ncbi:ARM repeat-containing protein [Pisolithus orientalis]|uniref:ARM repeat-containing protein n=1 Tax=Pisolithus orientalis TaxID=936130 RepID=UPI00222552CE|nr:ARM repeat-containing protein [Pisolithus orientalis]KAI6012746.1 ARM repeat-containing protein [Pisolithus orientalis]
MQSSPPQTFRPFSDDYYDPPHARTSAGSIWAPKQQETESVWPPRLDGFSGSGENLSIPANALHDRFRVFGGATGHSKDMFGPAGIVSPPRKKDIGAIGDGRKRKSPEFEDNHVEQLLRALNLNSPVAGGQGSACSPPREQSADATGGSPDLSPTSTTSTLLTPTDLSPAKSPFELKLNAPYEVPAVPTVNVSSSSLLLEHGLPLRNREYMLSATHNSPHGRVLGAHVPYVVPSNSFAYFDHYAEDSTAMLGNQLLREGILPQLGQRPDAAATWRAQQSYIPADWLTEDAYNRLNLSSGMATEDSPKSSLPHIALASRQDSAMPLSHEPINFLSLLHPSSSPPYHVFVARIIKSSDQQASIFLQQKLKVADVEERHKIVDAICARGFEMMSHRFGNWAVQRCLDVAATPEERRKIVACMRGRVVDLATNCYGCHVLQKALDCEEDIRLLIVSELLLGDPALTLTNKHASHVWSKIMELTWTPPAPPIFAYVNKSLKGKWASLACHETGSLVVQHAFENLEESAKDGIVDELLNQGPAVFAEICKNQWGSYCIQHILEHGSQKHRQMCLDHLINDLLDFATNEQGFKSVTRAFKEADSETTARMVKRMCEPAKGGRRAMIVDLALSVTGSQLIASILPQADNDQRALLYDCIRGHIVTLRGCKTGSKVIWLFDRMRAYYGY